MLPSRSQRGLPRPGDDPVALTGRPPALRRCSPRAHRAASHASEMVLSRSSGGLPHQGNAPIALTGWPPTGFASQFLPARHSASCHAIRTDMGVRDGVRLGGVTGASLAVFPIVSTAFRRPESALRVERGIGQPTVATASGANPSGRGAASLLLEAPGRAIRPRRRLPVDSLWPLE